MVDQKPKHSIFFYYMASVMAAMNSEFVTYPLDLIKTRLQIQGEIGAAKLGGGPKRGMLSTGIGIAREEGVLKLWRGLSAIFFRHLVYSGNRMISYMYFRESIFKANKGEYFPLWKSVLCGASAGAYAQFIANPADLFKVQMQMEGKRKLMGLPPRVSGLVDAFQQAWRAGGIRVLWKGAVPNTQRAALVNIGDLSAYDVSKRFLLEKTTLADATLLHVIASLIAGFTAAVIATPVDVIKTRVMNQPVDAKGYGLLYKSTRHCFKLAVKQEGVWSLYKGFIPHWIRLGPWALIFWVSYEKILHVMGARSFCDDAIDGRASCSTHFNPTTPHLLTQIQIQTTMRDATEQPSWPSRAKRTLLHRIHILEWLPRYTRSDVIADLVAGITVGLTMMPQSIAYAGLAGLPAQYGLYTAFIGSFTYVFFGTIKEVSIGPTSLMALLTFSYVEGYPIEFVILLTFIAGCMEFLMGVLKLGFLVDFISPCLTSGFTSASAIIIIVAQLKALLGLKLYTHGTFELLVEVCKHLYKTRLPDAILGGSCIVFLVLMKQLSKIRSNNPAIKKSLWFLSISKNALIVLITSIIGFYLHEYGGGAPFILTGPVPHGLPNFTLPSFTAKIGNETVGVVGMVQSLGSGVVVIPLVAILANVAIAKSFSPDIVDASQEMITLGMANIFGSFVQAMPSCGAFTRSAVASSSGVRTPIQGIYSGSIIILALSFLAPHFYYIPKATLAAVLITAAASLIDFEIYPILWKCNKIDFFITLGTFLIAIIFDVEKSIIIGAGVNAIVLLKKWTRPKIEWEVRKNGKVQEYIYVKPEVGLFYPAADYLLETVKKAHKTNDKLPIAIDCCNILSVDYAAAKTLQSLILTYNTSNMQLVLLNVKPEVFRTLQNIINTENLHLCQSTENICDRSFGVGDVEMPLLNNNAEDNRKMSMYDNV